MDCKEQAHPKSYMVLSVKRQLYSRKLLFPVGLFLINEIVEIGLYVLVQPF